MGKWVVVLERRTFQGVKEDVEEAQEAPRAVQATAPNSGRSQPRGCRGEPRASRCDGRRDGHGVPDAGRG